MERSGRGGRRPDRIQFDGHRPQGADARGIGFVSHRRVETTDAVNAVTIFPDPRSARGDIIAIGEDLSADTLREAYRHGIFPWPHDELPLPWFSPRRRAVIFFDELHIGRTLRRTMRRTPYTFTIDKTFDNVIRACASTPRAEGEGTWIGPEIIRAYTRLHR